MGECPFDALVVNGEHMSVEAIAIIPARSGSKSVRDKNIVTLGGFPLLAFSIVVAHLSKRVTRVILSTDSEEYAEIGRKFGAEVPFLRPAELSTDTATDRDFMFHAMNWILSHEEDVPEFWVHLRPTTPLREARHMDEAVDLLAKNPNATALRSAHVAPESPFKWFRRNNEGYLMSLTSENTSLDQFNLPRQAFPDVYIPDGYVDVIRSSFVLGGSSFHGDKVLGYESPPCTEVDSAEELDRLEFQLQKQESDLLEYLKKNFTEK
jgi:CMP-N,N'-diacetyllegionaminic acid synthase